MHNVFLKYASIEMLEPGFEQCTVVAGCSLASFFSTDVYHLVVISYTVRLQDLNSNRL